MSTPKVETRALGKNGPQVTRVGLGFVGHGAVYGDPGSDEERLAFLDAAYERGERFWDTGRTSTPMSTYHPNELIFSRILSRRISRLGRHHWQMVRCQSGEAGERVPRNEGRRSAHSCHFRLFDMISCPRASHVDHVLTNREVCRSD